MQKTILSNFEAFAKIANKAQYIMRIICWQTIIMQYEGGSICNKNPFITPSINTLGLYAICQTKDQSIAVIMVQKKMI